MAWKWIDTMADVLRLPSQAGAPRFCNTTGWSTITMAHKIFFITNNPSMLNRSAIIVRPKQPYINWASQLDNSNITPGHNDEPTIYLIPEYNDDSSAWAILEQIYNSIFDAELHAWHTETSDWPATRTFEMFRDWFDIVFVCEIADLSSGPILDATTIHPTD